MTSKSYTAFELAELTESELVGNESTSIQGFNTLELATSDEVSFLANERYIEAMKKSNAGLICISDNESLVTGKNFLVSGDPSVTFQKIVELLSPPEKNRSGFSGIHPTAVIHETATIGKDVHIGPLVVIDREAIIEDHVFLGAHTYIGPKASIGAFSVIYPNCTVREKCILKNRVILQPGVVIGSCGFGYVPDKMGKHQKLDQLGIVILEDDVEIGANTTIDRARFKATIIRRGTKIDNLVQIAHNVEVGEDNLFAAQTGIAGSSKTGKHVMLGGQVGILGHIELADQVMVATRGGVSKSLLKPGKFRGSPAIPLHEYNKQKVHVKKLGGYIDRIKELEKKIKELEEKIT